MREVTALPRLAPRPTDAHKASVGKVVVAGGSRDMCGAPALCALGALRAGAGLVRIAVPLPIQGVVAGIRPEATTAGLAATDGGALAREAADDLAGLLAGWDVLCLGPGAGRDGPTLDALRRISREAPLPLVLDADGLYALGEDLSLLKKRETSTVLTPHEGEAGRLLGRSASAVSEDRLGAARAIAAAGRAVVVLKGPGTIVTDSERFWRCARGGPYLASGGTGDVLTGIVGAFLAGLPATGGDAFGAACLAVQVHAAAGDRVAAGRDRGLLASDVANTVPDAVRNRIEADPPETA